MQDPETMMSQTDSRKVALLRGVNVGGVKVLMEPLRASCEALGWTDVKSYIASGNLVFRAEGSVEALAKRLEMAVESDLGQAPKILILEAEDYKQIVAAHPFSPDKGNQSHIYFCWDQPIIDDDIYRKLKTDEEELKVVGGHLHFHAPNGIGRSELADRFHKVVSGTPMTGRNLNTARKLSAMLDAL